MTYGNPSDIMLISWIFYSFVICFLKTKGTVGFNILHCVQYWKEQGSICETRAGPNRPQTRRGMVFVDFK